MAKSENPDFGGAEDLDRQAAIGDSGEQVVSSENNELLGQTLKFKVGASIKYRRLDKYLGGRFNHFSRTRLQKLIRQQGVNVNGTPAKPSHKLNPGDEIDLILPPREVTELIPEDIPINVIFEDDQIIVLNKQADLIVHPARGYRHGTLVNGLVYYASQLSDGGEDFRPGIVHRLDRNTTGVMVVAKTDEAHWKISRQFQDRLTEKTYLAVIHGSPELDADRINKPIGTHPREREKMAVRQDGKESMTIYKVLERFRGYSLIELSPRTGRTHQIRVHMTWLGHPIVSDTMYDGKLVYPWQIEDKEPQVQEPLMPRVALHAWKLKFKHPTSEEMMEFAAPPPDDLENLIDNLRKFRKFGSKAK
jgi:23S rRNA pseudouridine1911/1915/1917 synthase